MTEDEAGAAGGAGQMARIEALMARYPDVTQAELRVLKHWFDKEASALDVALLASKEAIRSGYAQYRADHVDRFCGRDIAVMMIVAALLVSGGIAAFLYLVP